MKEPFKRPTATRYARGQTRAQTRNGSAKPHLTKRPNNRKRNAEQAAERRALVLDRLSGLTGLSLDWAQIREYLVATIEEILAERPVAPGQLRPPRLDIAVPAIEAMRYSGLKREFAILVASTMDAARAFDPHPAFIEILKQLTPDETRLLAVLPPPGQVIPMADLLHLDRSGHVRASLRHILPDAFGRTCQRRESIPSYVDNLTRLSLVSSPARYIIDDEQFYRELLSQDFVRLHTDRLPARFKPSVERSVLGLTDFGYQFRICCLEP